jgi:hypothetical protein
MADGATSGAERPVRRQVSISTGHVVELPVRLEGTMLGATFAAPRDGVAELLPEGLRPIRATPTGKAAVTLLSVAYRDVGVSGLDPYDEFAVIIPAHHSSPAAIPYASALRQATNGYVWWMPVTTEPSRAFGVDVWGFPKVVAEISHDDTGAGRETTVSVDGDRFVTFEVARPPETTVQDEGVSYTVSDGRMLKVPSEIDAAAGLWPFSTDVSVSFGEHPKAAPLRALDLGPRTLGRVSLDGDVYFHPGESV